MLFTSLVFSIFFQLTEKQNLGFAPQQDFHNQSMFVKMGVKLTSQDIEINLLVWVITDQCEQDSGLGQSLWYVEAIGTR